VKAWTARCRLLDQCVSGQHKHFEGLVISLALLSSKKYVMILTAVSDKELNIRKRKIRRRCAEAMLC